MKIAIIEWTVDNHYLGVWSLANVLHEKHKELNLDVFVNQVIASNLLKMGLGNRSNIHIINDITGKEKIEEISRKLNYDHIYVTSIYAKCKIFWELLRHNKNVHFGIHGLHEIFETSLYSTLKKSVLASNLMLNRDVFYKLRVNFPQFFQSEFYKRKIINTTKKNNNGKFVFFGSSVYNGAKNYIDEKKAEWIPFCIYQEPELVKELNTPSSILKICVPGSVNEQRRNYHKLLDVLEEKAEELSREIEISFLGRANKELDSNIRLFERIEQLKIKNLKINYFTNYLPEDLFSKILDECDVVLGNMNFGYNNYGKDTETGIIYNMIRAAKPGILPAEFSNIPELESSTLYFDRYSEIPEIIHHLIENKLEIIKLKNQALKNSRKFHPKNFVNNLS